MKLLADPLQKASQSHSHNPAVIWEEGTITYEELNHWVWATVHFLQKIHIKSADRIAIIAQNHLGFILLLLAIFRLKATACLLSPRLPMEDIQQLVRSLQCSTIFTDSIPSFKKIQFPLKIFPFSPILKIPHRRVSIPDQSTFSPDQEAVILLTSGSSGQPKAALLSIGNLYFNAAGANEFIPFRPQNRWLLSLPLYHVSGLGIIFRTILSGGTILIPDPDKSLDINLRKYHPTHLSLIPTQLYRLLGKKKNMAFLKMREAILLGGAPIPSQQIQESLKYDLPIFITYGLTEMASQVATSSLKESFQDDQLWVRILNYGQVKLAQDGEILVKGRTLFKGYIIKNMIDPHLNLEGWFPTGDMGQINEQGRLKILGRKDLMFISGGENIQPEEIEKALTKLDFIERAIVIPKSNKEYGFRPVAFIKTRKDKLIPPHSDIINNLARFLPRFKIPQEFFPWPKTFLGREMKIKRSQFLELIGKEKKATRRSFQ